MVATLNEAFGDNTYTASTTHYSSGGSGLACGGVMPKTALESVQNYNKTNPPKLYYVIAAAESMAQPIKCGGCLTGTSAAEWPNVASAQCGTCFEGTTTDTNTPFGAIALDLCPYKSNKTWCPKDGKKNSPPPGSSISPQYNHFDFLDKTPWSGPHDTGTVNFSVVTCPKELKKQFLPKDMCNNWCAKGVECGQGCPGMESTFECTSACK